jgi:hypothetical protein
MIVEDWAFLRVIGPFAVNIIPSILRAYRHLQTAFPIREMGETWKSQIKKKNTVSDIRGAMKRKVMPR